jgi:hypothetical protein
MSEAPEVLRGDGYAVAPRLEALGEGYGFRKVRNLSDSEDAVYLVIGGKDGYVGRDGRVPEGETSSPGPH